jgi:cell division protein FtsI (penicillin-binding protein 3)
MIGYNLSRTTTVVIIFGLFYLTIFATLYRVQIKHHKFFTSLGNQQYNVVISRYPERASIFDRYGKLIAGNKENLAAFVVPNTIQERTKLDRFLKLHFPDAYTRLYNNPSPYFMMVKRRLTPEQEQLILTSNLVDIQFVKEPNRFYPISSLGTVLGIVDIDNLGLMGLELYCQDLLAGTPSTYRLEKDARSRQFYFKKHLEQQGLSGSPITVTLDSDLQFLVSQELRRTIENLGCVEGAVLVMDPSNGDILTMVSYPDFDPNHTEILDLEKTKNKIVTEVYEFGSVMKVFLALAALAENKVTPEEIIDCNNSKSTILDGIRINTWKAHERLTFSEIIEFSNNIGTSKVAQRLGPLLYDHYQRCGFGKKTGITFPNEHSGFVNPPGRWTKQSIFSLSFGYEINATLLQLGCAFCMIARNGVPVSPRLIIKANSGEPLPSEPVYSPDVIYTLKEILQKTVTRGTAHRAQVQGYTIRGKTGTANLLVKNKKGKKIYDPTKNIFTFAAIVEKGDYQRVIITFLKEARKKNIYASSTAAPLFERIAHIMLIRDNVL